VIFDGHNDILLRYLREPGYDFLQRADGGHLDFERAREGGFAGGIFAAFVPNPVPFTAFEQYRTEDGYDFPLPDPIDIAYAQQTAHQMFRHLFDIEARSDGQFKIVRDGDELQACFDNGVMAAVMHVEGVEMFDTDLNALEVYYRAGLRSLGIVWSRGNAFAEGVPFRFPASPDTGPGLTDAGVALVKACNRLGIMIDLSHINERGFWDVAKHSDAPLVASHSNVHALCPITRNLTDKQLDAVKETGGLVGLNYATSFLREDGKNNVDTPLSVMVRHVEYMVERMGIDHVGLGSDFDGATISAELGDTSGLPRLMDALRGRFDESEVEKIAYKNWLRVLKATWRSGDCV
jgi:membrane dipeptidase